MRWYRCPESTTLFCYCLRRCRGTVKECRASLLKPGQLSISTAFSDKVLYQYHQSGQMNFLLIKEYNSLPKIEQLIRLIIEGKLEH